MVIIQLVHQMLMFADYVGRDQLRSETSWQVGLHVTGLLGAKAPTPTARTHRYPRETFAHALTATATELGEDSTALTKGAVEVPDVEGV